MFLFITKCCQLHSDMHAFAIICKYVCILSVINLTYFSLPKEISKLYSVLISSLAIYPLLIVLTLSGDINQFWKPIFWLAK